MEAETVISAITAAGVWFGATIAAAALAHRWFKDDINRLDADIKRLDANINRVEGNLRADIRELRAMIVKEGS